MGGFFGVASRDDCVLDLFFGTDYHSHLGTKNGGLAVCGTNGFHQIVHSIENAPFRSVFELDVDKMKGTYGIGCISDNEIQPLLVRSHLGQFAIATVGLIRNADALIQHAVSSGKTHFLEMSGGEINPTELAASLINQCGTIAEGIRHAQEVIEGSLSMLVMTREGIYAARDRLGRTPIAIGRKEGAYCAAFECFSYLNLGYSDYKELGPSEIVRITPEGCEAIAPAGADMRICSFLWVYYGYPSSSYEGVNVEDMRYRCGELMAKREHVEVDSVAGIPDSGTAHAIGYANASRLPFSRPYIKYTPTWPRSFMPQSQLQRSLIARMKLVPIDALIRGKRLLLIEDSIVRGTQMRETTEFLYQSNVKEVHIRTASPPLLFGCKYLNFTRSTSKQDLITRRVISRLEPDAGQVALFDYADPTSARYAAMIRGICDELEFSSLGFNRLDDMVEAIGVNPCKLCTYCFNGKE